ncbi:hypothetical protein [Bacillus cereus]|nr:hypothetical protein [Bacillus cereus]
MRKITYKILMDLYIMSILFLGGCAESTVKKKDVGWTNKNS